MEQATQPTTPSASTAPDSDRAAYERAQSVISQLIGEVPTLPHSVRTGRELSPDYDVHLYFGAGLAAGRGVLETAAAISAEVTRDDQHDGEGNPTSVWVEARATVRGVPVYAYGLTTPADADALLQETATTETAGEVTQPMPTVGTDPAAITVPAITVVRPLAAMAVTAPLADEEIARCTKCGCTEDAACDGGCYWVPNEQMVDLCSACATPQQIAAMVFTPVSAGEAGGK
ncbi:hypothetical protein [Streptomyces sp. EKS3.2]|uniref:hypothetical protein n=1 Tax=Streptomyces sp. EKS3.2 TaxID=3461008 RepID=UPI004041D7C4